MGVLQGDGRITACGSGCGRDDGGNGGGGGCVCRRGGGGGGD